MSNELVSNDADLADIRFHNLCGYRLRLAGPFFDVEVKRIDTARGRRSKQAARNHERGETTNEHRA